MVEFEAGELVKGAYVMIDGVEYPVVPAKYSGKTPLTPENLNKVQNDLKEEIKENQGTILYENSEGASSYLSLSEDIYNFKRAKIVYDVCTNSGVKYSFGNVKEIDLTGKTSSFVISEVFSNQSVYMTFSINETELNVSRNRRIINNSAGPEDGVYVYITKIIGYKEV